jgi:uncharacterized membrane protein YfcA
MVALLAAAFISLLALLMRGLTGFGAALVMTPLLLFLFETKTAVVASAMVQLVTGLSIAYQARHAFDRAYLKLTLPACLLGIAAGSFILVSFEGALLKRLLGVVTILFAIRSLWRAQTHNAVRVVWSNWIGYLAGGLSGLLGTLFGIGGPPIVVFLENQIDSKVALRATLIIYFLVLDSVRMVGYWGAWLITEQVWALSLVMLPSALLGAYLGTRLHLNINERVFRQLVGILLCVTGTLLAVGL